MKGILCNLLYLTLIQSKYRQIQTLPNNYYKVIDSISVLVALSSSAEMGVYEFKGELYDSSHKVEFRG